MEEAQQHQVIMNQNQKVPFHWEWNFSVMKIRDSPPQASSWTFVPSSGDLNRLAKYNL